MKSKAISYFFCIEIIHGGKLPDIEIKRGYEVLPNNNIRFGIKIINKSDFTISDVEVILDYNASLFDNLGNNIQHLGDLLPTGSQTAEFILRPLGCIHNEIIAATVIIKDQKLRMRPKEVHCIYPFLKEKYISRTEFFAMSKSGYSEEWGMTFEGITVDKLMEFLSQVSRKRLHKVDGFSVANGSIVYLSGLTVADSAYYLLTAVVRDNEGLTQVILRANSNNKYGLNGFLNEITDKLRHFVAGANAREIGVIKKEQAINIIDSIARVSASSEGSVNIQGEEKEHREDDGRKKKRKLEFEKEEIEPQKERKKEVAVKRKQEVRSSSKNKFFAAAIILGILAIVAFVYMSGSNTGQPNITKPEPRPQLVYVEIKGSQFNPAELGIAKGTTVRWTNMDSATHIIKGDDFESSPLNKRDMWSYTFDKKGIYNYSCTIHPYMPHGKVIVMD